MPTRSLHKTIRSVVATSEPLVGGPFPGLSSYPGRNLAVERQLLSLRNHQIGKGEQRVQLRGS